MNDEQRLQARLEAENKLAGSAFRRRFHLTAGERRYIARRGWPCIAEQAAGIVRTRLAPAAPFHDGRQTPWRGHVVFVAQHATACCCRGCLAKYHAIAPGFALSESEIEYVVEVLLAWLRREAGGSDSAAPSYRQPDLFD